MEVDKIDRKILVELDKDARQPLSQIARKLSLSQQVVSYRFQRLQEQGVLKGTLTYINTLSLGYRFYNIYLRLKFIPEDKEITIIKQLKAMPRVAWLVSLSGQYNLLIAMLAKDINDFQDQYNQVMNIMEASIIDDSVFIVTDGCQLPYPVLPGQQRELSEKHVRIRGEQVPVKETDLQILRELSGDARITALDIAQRLNAETATVANRLRTLLKSDLVQGFKPLIDMGKLGKQWHLLLLKLKYVDDQAKNKFMETMKTLPQTFFVTQGVGNWHMQLEFYCDDDNDWKKVLSHIFPSEHSPIVKELTEMRITAEHKCVYYPSNLGNTRQAKLNRWSREEQWKKPTAKNHQKSKLSTPIIVETPIYVT